MNSFETYEECLRDCIERSRFGAIVIPCWLAEDIATWIENHRENCDMYCPSCGVRLVPENEYVEPKPFEAESEEGSMKGLFIPEITAEMFRNGCLEGIEALMAEGEIYDIDYTGWIPVGERLPEEYGQYLCYCEGGECYVYWLDNEPWAEETVEKERILAWQPLPKPYKESEE